MNYVDAWLDPDRIRLAVTRHAQKDLNLWEDHSPGDGALIRHPHDQAMNFLGLRCLYKWMRIDPLLPG